MHVTRLPYMGGVLLGYNPAADLAEGQGNLGGLRSGAPLFHPQRDGLLVDLGGE